MLVSLCRNVYDDITGFEFCQFYLTWYYAEKKIKNPKFNRNLWPDILYRKKCKLTISAKIDYFEIQSFKKTCSPKFHVKHI